MHFLIYSVLINLTWGSGVYDFSQFEEAEKTAPSGCDDLKQCVGCLVFNQPWKQFTEPHSAYQCWLKCNQFETEETFLDPFDPDVCPGNFQSISKPNCYGLSYKLVSNSDGALGGTIQYFWDCDEQIEIAANDGMWIGEAIRAENYGLEEYPDGWGTLTYNRGDALKREKFEGFLEKGIINGYGTMWWTDGSKFTGQWINNTKSGWGTMFYANGDIFSGSWTDEKKDEGKYMYATGGDVSGKFESGKISGNVKNVNIGYSENLQDVFTGEIVSGARTTGTYTHSNGDIYEGNFEIDKGSYDAVGKYIWACGKIYEGTFKDGKPNGFGKMVYSKGDSEEWTYEGEFKDGKFEGNGKFTWSENNYYEGQFSNGQMTGVGIYRTEEGGLFDAAAGLYYPDANDKAVYHEAHFDGEILRFKKAQPSHLIKQQY